MKKSGIVRKVDHLGRIVLPVEMRRQLNISEKDALEIFVQDGSIVIRRHHDECVFCGSVRNVVSIKGRNVCAECISSIKNQ